MTQVRFSAPTSGGSQSVPQSPAMVRMAGSSLLPYLIRSGDLGLELESDFLARGTKTGRQKLVHRLELWPKPHAPPLHKAPPLTRSPKPADLWKWHLSTPACVCTCLSQQSPQGMVSNVFEALNIPPRSEHLSEHTRTVPRGSPG